MPPASKPRLELVPGLAGIPAAESAISYIDGAAGLLAYRGYPIEELARGSTFEETAWLLAHGQLPEAAELASFRAELAAARPLPAGVVDLLRALPRETHPMSALQASLAAFGAFAPETLDVSRPERCVARLLAAVPGLVAAFHRVRTGAEPVAPDPELSTAADFLLRLTGTAPDALAARVLDAALVLHADHTMNASTFTARVVASSEADPCAVISAAVGSLHGALHGGANERVLRQLEAIGEPAAVEAWLSERLDTKSKVMGFGHRVYTVKDPRAVILQELAGELFASLGRTPLYDVATRLEEAVLARLGDKGIYPNVDFFSGIVYSKLGIPTDVFTPVFAISRTAGWLAHWREQMANNRIFRPTQVYVGEHGRSYPSA